MTISLYVDSTPNKLSLEKVAKCWSNDFWPYDEVVKFLEEEHNRLFYFYREKCWESVVLFNIIDNVSELLYLFTLEKFRLLSISSEIFDHYAQYLRSRKVDTVLLEVKESNTIALNFYKKKKFKTLSVRKKYYKNGENALILSLDLKKMRSEMNLI